MAEMFANAIGYEQLMGRWSVRLAPLYADFAQLRDFGRILDVGCGTGALVKAIAGIARSSEIVGVDPGQSFVDFARTQFKDPRITFQVGDAMQLPFADGSFDVVVCQFAVMFFPDKPKAFSEARRVLRPGGLFVFNVWDQIEQNEFADVVTRALAELFPDDPPHFLARIPHGYHDLSVVVADLAPGGFDRVAQTTTLTEHSRADAPSVPAVAYCQGTPLRTEIESRNPSLLAKATDIAADAIAKRFGTGRVDGRIQAHIIAIER